MTAKEKAEELVHTYRVLLMDDGEDYGEEILVSMLSKQCALIAVDEILSLFVIECEDTRYWNQVRKEILAL